MALDRTETIRRNILIAEFMGGEVIGPGFPSDVIFASGIRLERTVGIDELNYHSSWKRLMPVVKKIASIFGEWDFDEERRDIAEEFFYMDNMFSEFLQGDIEAIHERCFDFIEWYKKQEDND